MEASEGYEVIVLRGNLWQSMVLVSRICYMQQYFDCIQKSILSILIQLSYTLRAHFYFAVPALSAENYTSLLSELRFTFLFPLFLIEFATAACSEAAVGFAIGASLSLSLPFTVMTLPSASRSSA